MRCHKVRRWVVLFTLAVVAGTAGDVVAQAQRAGFVTVSTGSVSVARSTAPPAPLRFRDEVFVHDRISTGEHSLARILLGGKAVVTVSERTVLTITEVPGRSTLDLDAGRISLSVAREKMAPGDSIDIRTSVAIAGVRGTVVVAEILPGDAPTARFTVLKGLVEVSRLDPTTHQPIGTSSFLALRQSLLADRRGLTSPASISREAAERLTTDFQVRPGTAPISTKGFVTDEHVKQAVEHARDVVADRPGAGDPRGKRADRERGDRDTAKLSDRTDAPALIDAPRIDSAKPDVARPELAKPDVMKPDVIRPDVVRPDTGKSDWAKGRYKVDDVRGGKKDK